MHWDHVIDLGIAGARTYERWGNIFHCPVTDLGFTRIASGLVRDALAAGLGFVLDKRGIDWWRVISVRYVQQIYRMAALQQIAERIATQDEVFFSRSGFESRVLEALLGRAVSCFSRGTRVTQSIKHFYGRICQLSYSQITQIIPDKYDPEHRLRAFLSPPKMRSGKPVILLPTAYVNVTRAALAYAEMLPDFKFLLVVARSSGRAKTLPTNVIQADLASYVLDDFDTAEYSELCACWNALRLKFGTHPLLRAFLESGIADSFESALRQWLSVRDAWTNVFETEPVVQVLSCDDANPYTHIPGLLAKDRGVPWIFSHHGALDGHQLVNQSQANVLLAKGEMERDYLVSSCGIAADRVEVGAPFRPVPREGANQKSSIVFFSEDYEVSGGRVEEFYGDVLPSLVKLAQSTGKRIVIKLHPAESLRHRRRIVNKLLSRQEQLLVRIIDGPLTEELMMETWFALTVISTTALDCAIRGIPAFLCGWLENWPYGYLEQFATFRVGMKLSHPEEIARIPRLLETYQPCPPRSLWEPIRSEALHGIFSEGTAAPVQVA